MPPKAVGRLVGRTARSKAKDAHVTAIHAIFQKPDAAGWQFGSALSRAPGDRRSTSRRACAAIFLTWLSACSCDVTGLERCHQAQPITAAAVVSLVTLDGGIDQDKDDTVATVPGAETVFFDRSDGLRKTIMVAWRKAGRWTAPEVAPFSGQWFDQNPVVAPDGSYLLFNSDRPTIPGSAPLVQHYFGSRPGPGSNLWRVDRNADGWGPATWLGPPVDDDVFIDFASIAADGTLYYMRVGKPTPGTHIWRSRWQSGHYSAPEFVSLGDPALPTHDPAVAPDQSFIVFDYGRVAGGLGRLCIAFRQGDAWSAPSDLGPQINEARPWGAHVSSDGTTLVFTDERGIHETPLAPWIAANRVSVNGPGRDAPR